MYRDHEGVLLAITRTGVPVFPVFWIPCAKPMRKHRASTRFLEDLALNAGFKARVHSIAPKEQFLGNLLQIKLKSYFSSLRIHELFRIYRAFLF